MTDTRPRDLTAAELELLKAPAGRGVESTPLEIPPGTLTPVSLLNPAAGPVSTSEAPTAAPPDTQGGRSQVEVR
jgi:hypothetical protein